MKGIKRKWTKKQNDYIAANVGKIPNTEIAKNLGVPYPTFDNYLIAQGIKQPKSMKLSMQEENEIHAKAFKRKIEAVKLTTFIGDEIQGFKVVAVSKNIVTICVGNYNQAYTYDDIYKAKRGTLKLRKQKQDF